MPVLELSALQGKEKTAYYADVQALIQKVKVVEVRITLALIIRKHVDGCELSIESELKLRRAESLTTDRS